jgi:putative endonuclease
VILLNRIFLVILGYSRGSRAYMYYVYILAGQRNGTLYVGVTSNLNKRIWEHKNNAAEGFTKKYKVHTLVYFEQTENIESAIAREKRLKKYGRKEKLDLIEVVNPNWKDLYDKLF